MMKKIFLWVAFFCFAGVCSAAESRAALLFYKQQADAFAGASRSEERAYARSLADNLGTWALQNPTDANAPQVLFTQARLYLLAQDRPQALISLLKAYKMYPHAQFPSFQAQWEEALQAVAPAQRTTYAAQLLSTRPTDQTTLPEREADVLYILSNLEGKNLYTPAAAAFESFFQRYPSYGKNDQVELWYGDLHRTHGNYLAAISQYKKAATLYPNTPYRAASLRLTGDIYADHLNDTTKALEIYNQVLKEYPSSNEIGIVYKHMAVLEENNKNYPAALTHYDKAIEHLGNTPSAYEAYRGKADVYKKMKDYEQAYTALQKTANAFIADENKFVDPLLEASQIAKKKLRDNVRYTQTLEKALMVFPKAAQAPEIMYDLAQAYEEQGKTAQAIAMYKKLILTAPSGKYASKAQGRILKLGK